VHLDLTSAIRVGHSTGGGEVVRYLARHGESRVAKAAIISAVPPLMVKTPDNPGGLPKQVFDDFQAQLASNRTEFYRAIADGPFYNYNKPSTKRSEAIIQNWWRQGIMGGAKALREFRDMLVAVCDRVAALKRAGRSRNEAVAANPTAAFDAKFGNFVIDPSFFTRLIYEGV
jgi:pimeloyl-ACP methyl ester carboxylesterase